MAYLGGVIDGNNIFCISNLIFHTTIILVVFNQHSQLVLKPLLQFALRYNIFMVPSSELQHVVDRQLFPGTFVFHGISRPVIRKIDGQYCLAMFVTPFNVLDFTDGMFDRPYYWVTADIDTGKLIWVYQCYSEPTEEFCHSVYERRYDLHLVGDKPINRKYFDNFSCINFI